MSLGNRVQEEGEKVVGEKRDIDQRNSEECRHEDNRKRHVG